MPRFPSKRAFASLLTLWLCLLIMQGVLVQFQFAIGMQRASAISPQSHTFELCRAAFAERAMRHSQDQGRLELDELLLDFERQVQLDTQGVQLISLRLKPDPDKRTAVYTELLLRFSGQELSIRERISE